MSLRIPITERARRWGYIYWRMQQHEEVKKFLRNAPTVAIWLNDSYLGEKRVDWNNHRISIGPGKSKKLNQNVSIFKITIRKDESLNITCE